MYQMISACMALSVRELRTAVREWACCVKQQEREINPKKKDAIAWIVVIKYLKSSGDVLLLQTSFSDLGDHIF